MKINTMINGMFVLMTLILFQVPAYAAKHLVHVGNYYFNPTALSVNVGDTMRWVWDNGSHTTTSSSIPAGATAWDHPINSSNTFYEYHITVAGTYNYVCTPHAGMGMVASFTAISFIPSLNVSPSTQTVTSGSGSTTFTVTSNTNWSAASNSAWCAVTPSGTGNGMINAAYTQNPGSNTRVAQVTVTVTGLTPVEVTVSQDGTVGIEESHVNNFLIYPNPSNGRFTITRGETGKIDFNLTILDLNGRVVYTQQCAGQSEYQIDLSARPDGVYFMRMKASDISHVERIVITK